MGKFIRSSLNRDRAILLVAVNGDLMNWAGTLRMSVWWAAVHHSAKFAVFLRFVAFFRFHGFKSVIRPAAALPAVHSIWLQRCGQFDPLQFNLSM